MSLKEIPTEVKKMIDEGWCFGCSGRLQSCIEAGRCTKLPEEVVRRG